jgi:hypothetical protein
LVKFAKTLCGGGYTDSQLKVVSIDYFFLMKKGVWHALFAQCKGYKNGVGRMVSNVTAVLIVTTILSSETMP